MDRIVYRLDCIRSFMPSFYLIYTSFHKSFLEPAPENRFTKQSNIIETEGKDDETAFNMTIESIGDIEQTVREALINSMSVFGVKTLPLTWEK